MPASAQFSPWLYRLVRSVVGTSRCRTSVSACRLLPTTSLPMSAKPIALINNASRLCCSSTIVWLTRVALSTVLTRSGAASAYALSTSGATARSWLSAGRLGSTVARSSSRSPSSWPSLWPRPFSAFAIAPRVSFSFTGSIFDSTAVSCSNTVLISTVTCWASSTCPACMCCGDRSAGGISCTYLAPKAVGGAISTSTLAGMRGSWDASIARCRAACPLGSTSIEATLPTSTPRIVTRASLFITRPARGDNTVTGAVGVKLPRYKPTVRATIAAIAI